MSKIQKYTKKIYFNGGYNPYGGGNIQVFDTNLIPASNELSANQTALMNLGTLGQNMPNIYESFQKNPLFTQVDKAGDIIPIGGLGDIKDIWGGMDIGSKLSAGAGIAGVVGSIAQPLVDDQDDTTYTAGEIGADVLAGAGKGASMGSALGPIGTVVGGVIGAGVNIFAGGKKRKEARKAERKRKKAIRKQIKESEEHAKENLSAQLLQQRMQEKADILEQQSQYSYKKGGIIDGTRPEHLKYEHDNYSAGDYISDDINKYYTMGGKITEGVGEGGSETEKTKVPSVMDSPYWSLRPTTQEQKDYMAKVNPVTQGWEYPKDDTPKSKADERHERIMNTWVNRQLTKARDAGDAAFVYGATTGNPAPMVYGSILSGGVDFGRTLGSGIMQLLHPDEDWTGKMGHHAVNSLITLAPIKKLEKLKGLKGIYNLYKSGKSLKTVERGIENLGENLKGGPFSTSPSISQFSPIDFSTKFLSGGMTKGDFSHKKNPLTVVDKRGNDTGMELTGGEGVFDKGAMNRLEQLKVKKDYKNAGKLVFSEMDTWKDAGTAKYGTRLKEY